MIKQPTNHTALIETLSPLELKVIPFLHASPKEIQKKTGLDETSVLRALRFLEAKSLLTLKATPYQHIDLGVNGVYYKKHHLPERVLLTLLENNKMLSLEEAKKRSKLSENEFKVSLGVLKSKAFISLTNGKLLLIASREEVIKKMPEEQMLEALPIEQEKLPPELLLALDTLKKRKAIIEIKQKSKIAIHLTELGKQLAGQEIKSEVIEEVTPEIILSGNKNKKFRRYAISLPVPKIYGGKEHFVNEAMEYARRIWLDLGFKEMSGPLVESTFWTFDALFTPQDHPAREMQDTFFIKEAQAKLPDKKRVDAVQQAHESGVAGSKGWQYSWDAEKARKMVLRTHTTSLSARMLAQLTEKELPGKYFAIGKVFRNETVDWSHGFEFYQLEGIVIDEKANFRHLLGYLQEFYKKMGFTKILFVPSFYAYTEPSVEIQAFHPEKKIWVELGGAGMFRPEVTAPLFGKPIPVLAWGPGFDRIIMEYYKIKDLRELYSNNLKMLREKKSWIK